ncbi:hypothetical protein C8R46DRAFT_1044869 [Mycena filopes]|nr:hypothetical protein C8R46DRAFT_1044869 [Mycena filopes]
MAACAVPSSMNDVLRLGEFMQNSTDDQLSKLVPVFYALLDPVRIPTSDQLEQASDATLFAVDAAMLGLDGIYGPGTPLDAAGDLWPRVWAWVQFLDTFRNYIPGFTPLSDENLYVDVIRFAGRLSSVDSRFAQLVTSTPGFQAILFRAWSVVLGLKHSRERDRGLVAVFTFLTNPFPPNIAEILDGVGGTVDHLAAVLVGQILSIVQNEKISNVELAHRSLLVTLAVLKIFDTHPDLPGSEPRPLHTALLSAGIVKALMTALRALSQVPVRETGARSTLNMALTLLVEVLLTTQYGYRQVGSAVEHGLLRLFLVCGQPRFPASIHELLRFMLVEILIPSTTNYYVLNSIAAAGLAGIREFTSTTHSLALRDEMSMFYKVASERLQCKIRFDSEDFVSRRACDYPKCGVIREKVKLKRCSGCQTFFFCSKACQRLDWRRGGHRTTCSLYRSICIATNASSTARQQAFLRALLHDDYETHRRAHPVAPLTASFPVFDYTVGDVKVASHPLSAAHETIPIHRGHWVDRVARLGASEGRMELHVMVLRDADSKLATVIPLRRNAPSGVDVPEGMVVIH